MNFFCIREICCRKKLVLGSMSTKRIRAIIKRFEETSKLEVQPGRAINVLHHILVMASRQLLKHSPRVRAVSREADCSDSTIQKVLRKRNAPLLVHDPPIPGAA
ncbi:hypothetical protein TNCT_485181 [Trichonephila clavata]|uniref:Uncharacterized protein n=1 Tax=Trichonephila clavata TaxID=2740835 RepID=A0A8X6KCB2_TRICU|nr:hypothetical protein TNCT_485181 [Trichonephila clavata]